MVLRCIAFLLVCCVFFGCCRQDDLTLEAESKNWLPKALTSEITFQNQAGNSIVFKASTRAYNQSGSDKVCGSYDIETQEINYTSEVEPAFRWQIILSHSVLLSIKSVSIAPAASNISAQFNTVSGQFVSDPWRDRYFKELAVNNKTYQDVLHIYGNAIPGNIAFSEIYYAKGMGLVGFKNFAGVWYYLQ